ncbi:hypothetical protein [Maritalea porphyrae]|uniref:hypothetical protein n=1 Tax=Maritalea porphyrae TaxID=880732 RepID=UPI0022AF6B00|nr:hypothetical protein [Maritalea porphyrae]MCZ4273344.1 hypothetical protein [Maritalea porphyrae]
MNKKPKTVQQFIANRIEELRLEGKSQKVIAAEANYQNPNMLTMIKQGSTKVSFERAMDLEKALEIPKGKLLRLMIMEHFGEELFAAIQEELDTQLSEPERQIIHAIRSSVPHPVFDERAKRVLVALLS